MCGIAGIYGNARAAEYVREMLFFLQHRGQESTGIVSSDSETLWRQTGSGLVHTFFTEGRIKKLPGMHAIGQNRYSTSGDARKQNYQPVISRDQSLTMAHNGDLLKTPTALLRKDLEEEGVVFQGTTDTEVALTLTQKLMCGRKSSLCEALLGALEKVQGAYSFLVMNKDELIAVRDPYGFRPLSVGRVADGYAVASEDCALAAIKAHDIREVAPGELIHFSPKGMCSYHPFKPVPLKRCVFELVYFARPNSTVSELSVYATRKEFGRVLAVESPVCADVVIAVPDSGNMAAMGYALQANIPFEMGFVRSHYTGRSFIQPTQNLRKAEVELKLSVVHHVVNEKRVVVVDDSIVRGTTSKILVKMLREAGAREVHLRSSSPPVTHPCLYGIDTPTKEELLASERSIAEMCTFIDADSLAFLSHKGMLRVVNGTRENTFCTACFTGNYPLLS
jgi:amidophosphoribosyltransferase